MSQRVSYNVNPTPEEVRRWGYDEDLLLLDQDEDLILWDANYLPVLLELIRDHSCPKQQFVFTTLCQFSRMQVLQGHGENVARILAAWEGLSSTQTGLLGAWHEYFGRLFSYTQPNGPVSRAIAKTMANDLLLGPGRTGNVYHTSSARHGWWHFELTTSFVERLEINEVNGTFSYKRAVKT